MGDYRQFLKIYDSNNISEIKNFKKKVKNVNNQLWFDKIIPLTLEIMKSKFLQDPEMIQILLQTNNKQFVFVCVLIRFLASSQVFGDHVDGKY